MLTACTVTTKIVPCFHNEHAWAGNTYHFLCTQTAKQSSRTTSRRVWGNDLLRMHWAVTHKFLGMQDVLLQMAHHPTLSVYVAGQLSHILSVSCLHDQPA